MHSVVVWADDEQITAEDLTLVGTLARESFDFLTADAISVGTKFAGFNTTQASATALNIGAGRFYKAGQLFANADQGGVALDVTNYLPLSAGNTKIVSLVAYGTQAPTDIEPRTFLLDASVGTTEARQTANENERHATLALNANAVEGPSPLPPAIAADQVEIARIILGVTGIQSITYVEANRLQTIDKLDGRLTVVEAFDASAGKQIQVLGSSLADLAGRESTLPSAAIFQQLVKNIADINVALKLPQTALSYHEDKFLALQFSDSDITNAAYVARVMEGIRFAWAQEQISYLSLLNPMDTTVQPGSGTSLMLPKYTELARIVSAGYTGEKSLAQYQYQTIQAQQKQISRQVLQWGTSETVCDNSVFWSQGTYDANTGIFTRNGETFKAVYVGQGAPAAGHELFRITQFWTSTQTDTYTEYVTNTVATSGAILAQTFLNSQGGWATSVDIFFSRIASAGDVTMLLCTTANGVPDFTSVVANVTVPVANLKSFLSGSGGATNFPIKPTYLDAGRRYAIVLVTPGNHYVATTSGNTFSQGTLFYSTDGAFAQGDITSDLTFNVNFAHFAATVAQVQMTPLQLANGITDVKLLYGAKIPDGCEIVWEVQQNGLWYPLKGYTTAAGQASGTNHPLLGLPALLPLRVTFIGTTELMPGIDMSVTETRTGRPRGDFTHATNPVVLPAPSKTITTTYVVDYFNPNTHTFANKLTVNGSDVAATAVTTVPDPNKPGRYTIKSLFSLAATTSSFVIKSIGTTSVVTSVFHVESRFDFES